jgi:antitoxin MazE
MRYRSPIGYLTEHDMQVSNWSKSLAIRLVISAVEALQLKAGSGQTFGIARTRSRERALGRIRGFRKQLPVGWKFDRQEANAR